MMALAGLAALLGLGGIGSWLDLTQRRLPNWLSGLALLAGLLAAIALGGAAAAGWHALHAAAALIVGMGLYALGVIGAGDAKYYAALAAWFPVAEGLRLFVAVSMSGLVLLIVSVSIRLISGKKLLSGGAEGQEGLPYGVAIAGGAALLAIQGYLASA
ncbi:MAG: prepilin peptidase [Novosphingobium sp.]